VPVATLVTVLLLGAAFAEPATCAEQAAPLYRYAAAGAWVDRAVPDYDAPLPVAGGVDGLWHLLIDWQVDVRATGDDTYQHIAVKVLDASGVEDGSQFNLVVDPTYQSLRIHSLRVVRYGKIIDQQPLAKITALPQETELWQRIYNGRYNINVLLSDVRVGDVIEYEYTIHSQEKNFPGHYAARFSVGWSIPVLQQRVRLRYPADRPMRLRLSDGGALPAARAVGGMREFLLEKRDLTAIPADDERPAWSTPWPYLEVTDLPDWAAVTRLTGPMYRVTTPAGAEVALVVAQIRAEGGSAQQQALRALQYVQEHVRYTSISIGPGAFRPTDPEIVLERRFGDCKDKALLLVTMLRALGIESDVALVNSATGRILNEALPTPYAFDHAIVRATIGPAVYWLDGTAARQYAPLSTDTPADFERALPVHGASRELETIPRPSAESHMREVVVTLDLRKGVRKPGNIDVTTRYRGALADRIRPSLKSGSREQRQADYVNYWATYYPDLRVGRPLSIKDDPSAGVLEVHEHYVMAEPFRRNSNEVLELLLHADELYRYAEAPESSVRTAPLALAFPVHVRQIITVRLPEEWPVEPSTVSVENPAFRYRGQVVYEARTLTLTYEYQALKDTVEPKALAKYLADRKRFNDDIGYQLTWDPQAAAVAQLFDVAPLPLVVILLALGLGAWSGRRLYRYDPEPAAAAPTAPVGIRGWLLLPALGAILGPILLLVSAMVWGRFIGADLWHALPDTVAAGHRWSVQPVLLLIVGSQVLLLCWSIVLAVLFFAERSSVPMTYVTVMWVTTITTGAMLAYIGLTGLDKGFTLPKLAGQAAVDGLFAALWTMYMFRSMRVRATFRARLSSMVTDARAR
jgi:transglutaminase-like putative cysteine protease